MLHAIAVLLLVLGDEPGAPARPLPAAAHNCYPVNGQGQDRLTQALALGIDNIEIDLGWDAAARRLIVGHDPSPRPGVRYPDLEAYLVPSLEAHWRTPRADRAPTVLTVDWKTANPDAVRAFHAFLEAHADWFSSAPKAADSPLTERRLTVCLSGEEGAKAAYDALVPAGGTYRAFSDSVDGAGAFYRDEVANYAPAHASAFHRFLAFYWGHVERGGPPRAGDWTDAEADRLKALVARAHEQGYRVRFYTLNGRSGRPGDSYRFADEPAAQTRWRAARDAGADWVASDDYAEVVATLSRIAKKP